MPASTSAPSANPDHGGWRSDLRILVQMARGRRRGVAHATALDAFYRPQAAAYDRFREKLLPGRDRLIHALPLRDGDRVIDFGAGTGRHWDYAGDRLASVASLELIDLCEPLLDVARERFATRPQVRLTHADATTITRAPPVDLVVFSYSLSMMPDWRTVLDRAWGCLRPGGHLAMVDFYTLPACPPPGFAPMGRLERTFWPRWFGHDGVWLRPEVAATLQQVGRTVTLHQGRSRVPYLMGLQAPWFLWIGQKPPA